MGKVYERVLLARISQLVEHDLPSLNDGQNGFRKGRDSAMHAWVLQELMEMVGDDLLVTFLDIKAALASIRRSFLLKYLHDAGVTGDCWHAVASFYTRTPSRVWVGKVLSPEYEVTRGIREGAILSPILFSITINALLVALSDSGCGIAFQDPHHRRRKVIRIASSTFADDVNLTTTSVREMQALLDIAGKFALDHGLRYSFAKTRYLLFRGKRIRHKDVVLRLHGMTGNTDPAIQNDVVVRGNLYKYLGYLFHEKGGWGIHASACIRNAKARMADLRSTIINHELLSPATSIDTLRTYVQSAIAYSGFLWLPLGDLI
jgi:hypothetical protein